MYLSKLWVGSPSTAQPISSSKIRVALSPKDDKGIADEYPITALKFVVAWQAG